MNNSATFYYFSQARRFLWAWSCSRSGLEASGCFSLWRIWSAGREQSSAAQRYLWPACFCVLSSLSTNGKTEHASKELQKGHWWTGWPAVRKSFSLLNEVAQMKGSLCFSEKLLSNITRLNKTMLDCHKSNPWKHHCIKAFRKVPAFICVADYSWVRHVHIDVFSGNFLVMVMKVLSACRLMLQECRPGHDGSVKRIELNSYWFFNGQWQYLERRLTADMPIYYISMIANVMYTK